MAPPQVRSASQQNQAPRRKQPGLPARSRSSPPSQSYPARPQRKCSTIPKTRRFRHSVPRLSSISRCLGPTHVVTPFHHLSGDSHINSSLREGPLRHLANFSGLPKNDDDTYKRVDAKVADLHYQKTSLHTRVDATLDMDHHFVPQ